MGLSKADWERGRAFSRSTVRAPITITIITTIITMSSTLKYTQIAIHRDPSPSRPPARSIAPTTRK
jgi:hypothetical protein